MENNLEVKKIVVRKNALLNKTVTVKLLDYPNDKFVELIYTDENGKKLSEQKEKKAIMYELNYLVNNDKLKKANKTIMEKKNDNLKRPVNVYSFRSSINSKKTAIRVVGSVNGMYEEEIKELDALTSSVRKAHVQTNGALMKKIVLVAASVTMVLTGFAIGVDNAMASSAYQDLKDHRGRVFEDNERGANLNEFGEVWTDELYAQYKENLKDNVDDELELDSYKKFWQGEDLNTLKEQKALLAEFYERRDDFNDAKEEIFGKQR